MYVSQETPTQTQECLLRVIVQAELRVYDGLFDMPTALGAASVRVWHLRSR